MIDLFPQLFFKDFPFLLTLRKCVFGHLLNTIYDFFCRNSPSCVVTQLAWSDNLFLQEDLPLMMYESYRSEEDQLEFENEFKVEDNLLLAAATSDGRVIIWQWSPEREIFELETHQQLFSSPSKGTKISRFYNIL